MDQQYHENFTNPAVAAKKEASTSIEKSSAPARKKKKLNRLQQAISGTSTNFVHVNVSARKIKKAEKQQGILSALLVAPVEIFYEIAYYFSPIDLLCLCRVSRELRKFLLSKNSKRLWQKSMSSSRLPPCPKDLNEPQYCFLVFDTTCNGCGALHIKSVYYELRVRLCKTCYKVNVLFPRRIMKNLDISDLDDNIYEVVPYSGELKVRAGELSKERPTSRKYYKPDFLQIIRKYMSIEDAAAKKQYLKSRIKIKESIIKNAGKLEKWERKDERRREKELSRTTEAFSLSIKNKLKEHDYSEDDWTFSEDHDEDKDFEKEWLFLTHQPKTLTARIWKLLFPKVKNLINRRREYLNEEERNSRYRKRDDEFKLLYQKYTQSLCLTSGEIGLMPCADALLRIPAIESEVRFDGGNRICSDDVFFTTMPFIEATRISYQKKIWDNHEKAITNWRSMNGRRIHDIGDTLYINLASSVFQSEYDTGSPVYYFHSSCPILIGTPNWHTHERESCSCPSEWDSIRLRSFIIDLAEDLLAELGLPPTTTTSVIQAIGDRFVCCRCDEALRKPMGWDGLISHYTKEQRKAYDALSYGEKDKFDARKNHLFNRWAKSNEPLTRKLDDTELLAAQHAQWGDVKEDDLRKC